MRVQRVCLEGFKNIQRVNMQLDVVTAVIGRNNFGKTNLLQGLSFASEFVRSDESVRRAMMSDERFIPLTSGNAGADFRFSFCAQESGVFFEYEFSFNWATDGRDGQILSESLRVRKNGEFKPYLLRDGKSVYVMNEANQSVVEISPYALAVETVNTDDIFFGVILRAAASFSVDYCRAAYTADDGEAQCARRTDFVSSLIRMRTNSPHRFELWKNAVRSMLPQIREFIFQASGKESEPKQESCKLFVRQENLPGSIDVSRLSSGVRQIFEMILELVAATAEGYAIVEFEEPERSVSPRLIQQLLITLTNICDDCRIIITSHSPALVSFINPDSLYIGMDGGDNTARFFRIKPSRRDELVNMADEAGVSIGDLIFDMLIEDEFMGMPLTEEWVDKDEY